MEFQSFNKIPRLSRDIIITEKINGTSGQVVIISSHNLFSWYEENRTAYFDECREFVNKYCLHIERDSTREDNDLLYLFAGSHKRWLDTSSNGDNFGFAKWVKANAEELLKLGEGRHYGEWWGKGIQIGYGLDEKRFSLFNVGKWVDANSSEPIEVGDKKEYAPKCCSVVPILYSGMFDTVRIESVLEHLRINGSKTSWGFMKPEGIIIYHKASGQLFKKTILNDEKPKSMV